MAAVEIVFKHLDRQTQFNIRLIVSDPKRFIVYKSYNRNTCEELCFDDMSAIKDYLYLFLSRYLYNINPSDKVEMTVSMQKLKHIISVSSITLLRPDKDNLDICIEPLYKYLNMLDHFIDSVMHHPPDADCKVVEQVPTNEN